MRSFRPCFIVTALLLVSCAKAEWEPSESGLTPPSVPARELSVKTVPIRFDAIWDAGSSGKEGEDSKAYISGSHFYWQTGDLVGIYDNLRPDKHSFTVSANASDLRYATLDGSVTEGSTSWYAVYPYSAIGGLSDGACTVTLPAVQTMGSNRVDPSALITIATASHMAMSFHNVYALLSFKLSQSNITHIQLIGNQGSVLAGKVTVDPSTGEMTAITDPRTEIHLYPADECFETGVEYFVPILPYNEDVDGSTYLDGFTLIMYTSSETVAGTACYVKRTDKTLTLTRNQAQKLGTITSGTGYAASTLSTASAPGSDYKNSSMICFGFPGSSTDAYRAALYADEDCTQLVVAHNLSAEQMADKFSSGTKWLTFAGLDAGTTYWFRGIDRTTGQPTSIVSATTDSFTPVQMVSSAAEGDIVLAEDFSELCYYASIDHGDVRGASPYQSCSSRHTVLTPYTGELAEGTVAAGPVYYHTSGQETRMFCFLRDVLPSTRLADWAEYGEVQEAALSSTSTCPVCGRAGLLKIGASGYTGGIATPPLDFIPAGKKAVMTVKVKARKYSDTEGYLGVFSADGNITTLYPSEGTLYIDNRFFVVDKVYDSASPQSMVGVSTFAEYSFEVTAFPGSRIVVGADRTLPGTVAGQQCRLFVSEITLTLKSLSDVTADSDLTLSAVSWTQGTVGWTSESAHVYEVFLDGVSQGTVTASSTSSSMTLSSLSNGTTYLVSVVDNTSSSEVGTVYMTTASLWQNANSTGQRFLSIGWTQMGRSNQHGDTQAYQVQVYDVSETECLLDFVPQPGQGYTSVNYTYGNYGVLGYAWDKDLTARLDQGDVFGGSVKIDNYLLPTGVSVGGFDPGTSYKVRIRTLEEADYYLYASKGEPGTQYTVTHAFGTSAWSDFVTVSTDAARAAASDDELLWCGFEDCCIQQDYPNRVPGSVPFSYKEGHLYSYAPLALSARADNWTTVCFYGSNAGGHQTNTWNLSDFRTNIDGVTCLKGYATDEASTSRGVNNVVVGDMTGWYCKAECKPRMGQLELIGISAFINSPALTDAYLGDKALSATGTACTLSFHAVMTQYRNTANGHDLLVRVWRASQSAWETVRTITETEIQPWGDTGNGVSDTYYWRNDYSKRASRRFSVPLTLYPGDAIRLETTHTVDGGNSVLIDDILLVKN